MSGGLRIKDAAGNIIFDFADRFARIIGEHRVNQLTGSFEVDATYGGSIWFQYHSVSLNAYSPQITASGNTISWTFTRVNNNVVLPDGYITYGRY